MERFYSLRRYSSSITWLLSVCLALLSGQIILGPFNNFANHLFLSGILIAVAIDQGIDLFPQFTSRFKKMRAFNLLKSTAFMVLAIPAFALILKGGFIFTTFVGGLAFLFTEICDLLKPYLGEITDKHLASLKAKEAQEISDQTQRDPLHEKLAEHFKGRNVLVMGRCHVDFYLRLASYGPSQLILYIDNVDHLNEVYHCILEKNRDLLVVPFLKVSDHRVQIPHIFDQYKPDVIIDGAFVENGPILNQNPTYATQVNVIDTIDWVDAARKFGVSDFALILPLGSESSVAAKCFSVIQRYCTGLRSASPDHPTRLMILEKDDTEALLVQYLHGLSEEVVEEPADNFSMFQRALHQLEWAVNDYNNREVQALLDALTHTPDVEESAAA